MAESLKQRFLETLNEYRSLGISNQIDYQKFYLYMRLAHQHTDFSIEMLKDLSAIVMKNTGGQYNTAQGSFDAAKGDLRLVGVTAGVGGRSYMNYQKVPVKAAMKREQSDACIDSAEREQARPKGKLAEFCQQVNERRHTLLQSTDIIEQYLLSFDAHYLLVTIHPPSFD